jgi:predicted ribosome quality control (RQC) complex YloA/Tae2 family protein
LASKGRPYKTVHVDGFEVLVGKGDVENDRLTFEVAEPDDLWLHVAGYSGSHVVIRNPDALPELPGSVVERAAELAAWHSKGRSTGKVEVHVCKVSDVRKPRGFVAGKVQLRQWTSLRVYARGVDVEPS